VLVIDEVSDRLGLPTETVRKLLEAGHLPGREFDGQWRIYWPAVLDALSHGVVDPDVVGVTVLAQRLGMNESTVRSLLSNGSLPGKKIGKQWYSYWPSVLATLGQVDQPKLGNDHGSHEKGTGG